MPDADILIQRYVEGTLSEVDAEQLHRLLESQPDLGAALLNHLEMDAMLRASKPLISMNGPQTHLVPKRRFTMTTVASVAAIAACLMLALGWMGGLLQSSPDESEATTASVAVLTRGVNLEWESAAIAPGTPLTPGSHQLRSGMAQIEFYQGARITIEGPAAFDLLSSGRAALTRGRLRAEVPAQATGFEIETPQGRIVDLGTEFGLEIDEGLATIHVFEGEVELHALGAERQSLVAGQAASFVGSPELFEADPASFSSLERLDVRSKLSERGKFSRWLDRSRDWNGDPALRLRFDFQDSVESRSLTNRAISGGAYPDGSIVGASWTEGRWPGKGAIEFRQVSDRVRLSVPGELGQLTLATWVRVNGLDRTFNSLLMSEGWGERRVHWQIKHDGRVRLGVASGGNRGHADYDTPVVFTPERFGRWIHLAVVFDPDRSEVRHYVDGENVAQHPLEDASPLRIGIAELGNWNDQKTSNRVAIRHLSGAMDEFALWDRVLADDEIAALAR
jgi:hypothetical protein